MRAPTTLAGSKPRSRVTSATKLRSSSPAPVSSTSASATCVTASAACPRLARSRPKPPAEAPVSLRVRAGSTRDQASAGAVPNSRPATTDTMTANASTAPSTPTSASPGTLRGASTGAARAIPRRHGESDRPAGDTQDDALGQQLADDPAPPGAERAPDGQLPPPPDPARQQQTGHVGARHQQHQPRGRGQHQERRPERGVPALPATR